MTTQDSIADSIKHYAFLVDNNSHFDCIIEADSHQELKETVTEYLDENKGHKVLFSFEGRLTDLTNIVENLG